MLEAGVGVGAESRGFAFLGSGQDIGVSVPLVRDVVVG